MPKRPAIFFVACRAHFKFIHHHTQVSSLLSLRKSHPLHNSRNPISTKQKPTPLFPIHTTPTSFSLPSTPSNNDSPLIPPTLPNKTPATKALYLALTTSLLLLLLIILQTPYLTHTFTLRPPPSNRFTYRWVLSSTTNPPNPFGYLSAWLGYLLHQLSLWLCIHHARQTIPKHQQESPYIHNINWITLFVNLCGVLLHVLQTHFWFDGLARDTPEILALGSVALLLVWVMVMESGKRGVCFGAGRRVLRGELVRCGRDLHPWVFSWACVWNFWFHPCVGYGAFVLGFWYKFMLLVQASLMMTNVHRGKWWRLVLETWVLVHGVLTPLFVQHQRTGLWIMFFMGFLGTFVGNQLYAPEFGIERRGKLIVGGAYLIAAMMFLLRFGLKNAYVIAAVPVANLVIFLSIILVLHISLLVQKQSKVAAG